MTWPTLTKFIARTGLCLLLVFAFTAGLSGSPVLDVTHAVAQEKGAVPGNVRGNIGQAEMWRGIRGGLQGNVSIPDKKAGVLVQSEGDNWRAKRNGPIATYGAWAMAAIAGLLVVFFLIRGRIKIHSGLSGRIIQRFNSMEVFGHWLTASSFIVLGITGLLTLYGKYFLLPIIGKEAFASLMVGSKYAHNYLSFAFMLGIVLLFIHWAKDNLWDRHDANWLFKAGGLLTPGVHPPANKFNMGQKIIFWSTIIGGVILSVSGLNLLFPFQFGSLQDMQDWQLLHGIAALVLVCIIFGHIYIGSIGMQGAFSAISTGYVDENWAREHHSEWVKELEEKGNTTAPDMAEDAGKKPAPAE